MPFDVLQPFTIVKATELKGAASWWSYTVRQGRRTFKDLDEKTLVLNQNWDEISAKWKRSLKPRMETFIPEWVECDRCGKHRLCDPKLIAPFANKPWTCANKPWR